MAEILNLTNYEAVKSAQSRLLMLIIETNGAFDALPAAKRDSVLNFQKDIGNSISMLAQIQIDSRTDSQFEFSMNLFNERFTKIEQLWESYKNESLGGI